MRNNREIKKYAIKGVLFLILLVLVDSMIGHFLRNGLEKYYGLGTSAQIALVGHSHLMLGIDKEGLEEEVGVKVAKYTREGVNVYDRDLMINQLIDENQEIKTVIYGVDAWMFTGEGLSANSYKLFYPFMSDNEIRSDIKNRAEFLEYWQNYLIKTSRYNEGLMSSSVRGYLGIWSNYKFGTIDTVRFKEEIERGNYREINSQEENRRVFERSINKLNDNGIRVVLIYVPTIGLYNRLQPNKFNQELEYFRSLDRLNINVYYLEYIDGWEDRYELFFDPIHLNPKGQELITNQLIEDLKKIENR